MAQVRLTPFYRRIINKKSNVFKQTVSRNIGAMCMFSTKYRNDIPNEQDIFCNVSLLTQTRLYSTMTYLSNKNVFKSTISDISNYHGLCIHDLIWKNAEHWWNKTALVCAKTDKSYTYEELRKCCGKFATSLRKNNVRPGDTIAVILPNVPEYAIILLGASEAGITVTLLNPLYTAEEMKKQLDNSESVAVITLPVLCSTIDQIIRGNAAIRLPVIVVDDGSGTVPSGMIKLNDLIAENIEEFINTDFKNECNTEQDTYILAYSSGTSGLPKGVELTHRNIVVNTLQILVEELCPGEPAFGEWQEVTPLLVPIFHSFGFHLLFANLRSGTKNICMPQFSSMDLLNVLDKNKATIICAVPPVIQLMINDSRFTSRHMEHMHFVLNGATHLDVEVMSKFLNRFGNHICLSNGYGMTETSPTISLGVRHSNIGQVCPQKSVGRIVPNTEVRIVGYEIENEGKNLAHNECGEIYVRGPQIMKGYFKNPQATQECMDDDWLKTGDTGYFNNQGYLYIYGRLKELIKVQGFQVAPAELENIIQRHENVADVAVIGVPHDRYGEIPKAFIVPKLNMKINEQEIKDFVAQHVVKYKQLGDVAVIDKIPKSASGKILRKELSKI